MGLSNTMHRAQTETKVAQHDLASSGSGLAPRSTAIDLARVVASARRGDQRAVSALVERFQGMAVAYGFSILGDFHAAEDAAQEALVEALARLPELRIPVAFPSWLRRIVFKHCDRTRRRSDAALLEPARPDDQPDVGPGPREHLEASERRRAVEAAIGALEPGERAVVSLFYMEDRSHAEIAEFLGLSPSAVKSRLHRARHHLERRLVGWVADVMKEQAPGPDFAARVARAVETFGRKGPDEDATNSEWSDAQHAEIASLLEAGEEGFRAAVALSRMERSRLRERAALHFALAGDPRGRPHLERLLDDPSGRVRVLAVRAYAALVRPGWERSDGLWSIGRRAAALPQEPSDLEPLVSRLDDPSAKARWVAVLALGAYQGLAGADRAGVEGARARALDDPIHKVRHAAARALGRDCPGCGARAESQ